MVERVRVGLETQRHQELSQRTATSGDEVHGEVDLAGVDLGGSGKAGVGSGGMVTKVEAARLASLK